MKYQPYLALVVLVVAGAAQMVRAESIAITNAGFENPALAEGNFTTGLDAITAPGWTEMDFTGLSDYGVFNPPAAAYPNEAPEGHNVGVLWSKQAIGSGEFGLIQELEATLQANTRYTLQVEIGDPLAYDQWQLDGFPGYRVELLAGGEVLAADDNTLAETLIEGEFVTSVVQFVSPPDHPALGEPLEIRLLNLLIGPGREIDFDDVRLDAAPAIPEPTTAMLAGAGLMVLLGCGVRRRKRRG